MSTIHRKSTVAARRPTLAELEIFVSVARAGSLRRAADLRNLTPSAISHSITATETRLGVRLFHRTTRTLKLTEPGEMLLAELTPHFEGIDDALENLEGFRETPRGRVRVSVLRDAMRLLVGPKLPGFAARYPDIKVDVSSDDKFVDVIAEGFDAGIRYGGTVPEDMVAARLSPDLRWVVVGAPGYLDARGRPIEPGDLIYHACIRIRTGMNRIYHWELGTGADSVALDVPGHITLDDSETSIRLAVSGGGLFYCLEKRVATELKAGLLEVVLPDFAVTGPGFYAYYASHRQIPTALRAFIDYLKEE
jgi:DNA-binding transcriptional LysR family regulator